MGTVAYRTLERLLNFCCRDSLNIKSIGGINPYFLTVRSKSNLKDIHDEIVSLCKQRITAHDLVSPVEAPKLQKYDEFIPPNLRRKAFALDYLDMVELREIVSGW